MRKNISCEEFSQQRNIVFMTVQSVASATQRVKTNYSLTDYLTTAYQDAMLKDSTIS